MFFLGGIRAWRAKSTQPLTLFAPALLLVGCGWRRRWVANDAFVDFRVVQNLWHGAGPVFNVGERVEAYTSPLWVGLLAMGRCLPLPIEWTAVLLGLLLTLAGLVLATVGAARLWRSSEGTPAVVPFGSLLVVGIAAYWDFCTSGLECGLVLAWLGGTFAASTLLAEPLSARRAAWLGGWLGLFWVVRPDLAPEALAWLMLLIGSARGLHLRATALLCFALVPGGYELFRMGYFAALLPNAALAREISLPYWSQGARYLTDFYDAYHLRMALLLAALGLGLLLRRLRPRGARAPWIALAPTIGGALQGLFIVRAGGDFMHARLLLPPLFALLLPVMAIGVGEWSTRGLALTGAAWAIVSFVFFRAPYASWPKQGGDHIGNARGIDALNAHRPHPVLLDDHAASDAVRSGRSLAELAAQADRGQAPHGFSDGPNDRGPARLQPSLLVSGSPQSIVAVRPDIGLLGMAAGPSVFLCDTLGLADPIVARVRLPTEQRGKPGHEKWGDAAWCVARRLAEGENGGLQPARVAAARAALACPPLSDLLTAVDAPLTFARFADNLSRAAAFTALRVPAIPEQAKAELCGG